MEAFKRLISASIASVLLHPAYLDSAFYRPMLRNLLLALASSLTLVAAAQSTWRFPLAFEDGTGAKDTIWFLYDTLATTPGSTPIVDYSFGEGPVQLGQDEFHVFILNSLGDTTQTQASNYSWFPIFQEFHIYAFNWVPPMTIRWDTSLFHAAYLPYAQGSFGQAKLDGNYFFFHSNDMTENGYNMLITDSAFVNEDFDFLFPIPVYFGLGDPLHIGSHVDRDRLEVFPNPASSKIELSGLLGNGSITIRDQLGRTLLNVAQASMTSDRTIDISTLPNGIYFVQINTPNTPTRHAKFQKME